MSNHLPPDRFPVLSPEEGYRLGQIYSLIPSWQNDECEDICPRSSNLTADDNALRRSVKPVKQR